jgi:flavorubredoxin
MLPERSTSGVSLPPRKLVMSQLWVRFMGHYGLMDMGRIVALEDHGARIKFGNDYLQFIPAHFLHSPGNFSLYDSRSKILFSGDIGAAIASPQNLNKRVDDFRGTPSVFGGVSQPLYGVQPFLPRMGRMCTRV